MTGETYGDGFASHVGPDDREQQSRSRVAATAAGDVVTATIRVRVDPAGSGDYVIYADPDDRPMPWLGQTAGGDYTGWLHENDVADWPEVELRISAVTTADPELPGSP